MSSIVPEKTSFYIGLSDWNEHGRFAFLDGSAPNYNLPWEEDEPEKDNEQHCAMFYEKELYDVYCNEQYQFICQTGPGTCEPTGGNSCPDNWIYWQQG